MSREELTDTLLAPILGRQPELRAVLAVLATCLTYLFGEPDKVVRALLLFMAIDVVSGLMSAWWRKTWNSREGWKGLVVGKGGIMLLIIVAHHLDVLCGTAMATRTVAAYFLAANELKSIFENLEECGRSIPAVLKKFVEWLVRKGDTDIEGGQRG